MLEQIWRTLLSSGAMQLFLVEDRTKPIGSRVVSFSAIVFVTDEFCSEARSTLPPYLGVELVRRYLLRQLPVLNREQVARANAGDGLNVAMCFEGWAQDGFSPEQLLAVREKQSEAFHLALHGYRLKEFLAELIGFKTSQWMIEAGARVRQEGEVTKTRKPVLAFGATIPITFEKILFRNQSLLGGHRSSG